MRIVILACVALGLCGSGLYMVKRSIDARYKELKQLEYTITTAEDRAAILAAEWAYLSRPDRIISLSSSLLSMRPIEPDHILPLDAIPLRRPAPARPQTEGDSND